MDRPHPLPDFDVPAPSHRRGWAKRVVLGAILVVALLAATMAGYGLGRGAWTIPGSLAAALPAPLARWLPGHGAPASAPAELNDYAFELVEPQAKQGEAVLTVRLVDKRSGQLVPDAVIFARRLDMAPEGMPTMTAPIEPQPAAERGVYRFKADLMMEGSWRLSLGAKVQGETGTVQDKLVLKAVP